MSKKEFVLDQLTVCRNMESWIKPLSMALEGLTVEDVLWRQNEDSHTIGEIANHLRFYNERWIKRFTGEPITDNVENNDSTFMVDSELSEENWLNLVHQLDEGLSKWQQMIHDSPESKLEEPIPNFPENAVWWEALSNLCTHNAYHIGQIIFIRKAQGSWRSIEE